MLQFLEAATIALQAIWANKIRSLFTVLGNIVAVTSIIAVVSLVQGLNASVKDALISTAGADAFSVQRRGPALTNDDLERQQSNPRISLNEAAAIRAYGGGIGLVMAEADTSTDVKYASQSLDSITIRGVSKEFNSLPTTNVERGRPITGPEFDGGRYVTVLGYDTADRLFGPIDPLDKTVSIQGVHFQVVGVAAAKGALFGNSQDEFAIIPLVAFRRMVGAAPSLQLTVMPAEGHAVPSAMDDATMAMRIQRRLRPRQPDNFGVVSSGTFLAIYEQATAGLFAILIGVVSLSLVVGGIVIMNIMLMVVTERTREIGLRKSLGARRRDILWQILTESVTLSTFGGLLGTGLGFAVAFGISKVSPLPAIVEPWSVILGIGMTAVVGLFFGLYPALRAASLDPIEALRRE
jgi:putative ABC transport system permease protein